MRHATRLNVPSDTRALIRHVSGGTQVSGAFFRKMKRKAKKAVGKVVKVARKVAKNKAVQELYKAAKQAAPSPYKEGITAAEVAVRFTDAMTKNTAKGRACAAALPTVQALAKGAITPDLADKKARALGLKPSTLRNAAIGMKLRASSNPQAKAVMGVVSDIHKLTANPTKLVEAASGRKYEVLVRAAG
jgi:translation elongation factor EF-G